MLAPSAPPLDAVGAELYDLSDTARPRSTTVTTFVAPIISDALPPLCDDVIA